MNEKQEYRMGVGASSVLMIFVVLAMTTLAVLSFASARADLTLTQRRQTYIEGYQGALAESERALAQLDQLLLDAQADAEGYAARVQALTLEGVQMAVSEDLAILLEFPFGDEQVLEVTVQVLEPGAEYRFTRTGHAFRNTQAWEPDESWDLAGW